MTAAGEVLPQKSTFFHPEAADRPGVPPAGRGVIPPPGGRPQKRSEPETLGALVPRVLGDLGLATSARVVRLAERWEPRRSGAEVARHCQPTALRGGVLEATVDSSVVVPAAPAPAPGDPAACARVARRRCARSTSGCASGSGYGRMPGHDRATRGQTTQAPQAARSGRRAATSAARRSPRCGGSRWIATTTASRPATRCRYACAACSEAQGAGARSAAPARREPPARLTRDRVSLDSRAYFAPRTRAADRVGAATGATTPWSRSASRAPARRSALLPHRRHRRARVSATAAPSSSSAPTTRRRSPSGIVIRSEAIDAWVKKGAQLSPTVKSLMRRAGRAAAGAS